MTHAALAGAPEAGDGDPAAGVVGTVGELPDTASAMRVAAIAAARELGCVSRREERLRSG